MHTPSRRNIIVALLPALLLYSEYGFSQAHSARSSHVLLKKLTGDAATGYTGIGNVHTIIASFGTLTNAGSHTIDRMSIDLRNDGVVFAMNLFGYELSTSVFSASILFVTQPVSN